MGHTAGSQGSGHAGMSNAWPVFRSLYSYRIQFLTHDLFAGLTLAAIAIPEQMATARLGGFTPQIGFFAFLAGSLAFAMFGAIASCRAARIRPYSPPVHMIKLTREREIAPYVWVHPDDDG